MTPIPPPVTLEKFMAWHLEYSKEVTERYFWLKSEVEKWRKIADKLVAGIIDEDVYPALLAWEKAADEQEGIAP